MKLPTVIQHRLLASLGDPSRFRLVALLTGAERCVSDLAREVGLSQSCTTRHLQVLERAGLVCGQRAGKRVMYRICTEEPRVSELLGWALMGESTAIPAPRPTGPGMIEPSSRTEDSEGAVPPATVPRRDDSTKTPRRPREGSSELEDFLL